jgi:hypothetical protein
MLRSDTDDSSLPASPSSVSERVATLSRYDLVLAVIPLTFLLSALGASVFTIPMHRAVAIGGVVCLFALFDAMFINPPRQKPPHTGQ